MGVCFYAPGHRRETEDSVCCSGAFATPSSPSSLGGLGGLALAPSVGFARERSPCRARGACPCAAVAVAGAASWRSLLLLLVPLLLFLLLLEHRPLASGDPAGVDLNLAASDCHRYPALPLPSGAPHPVQVRRAVLRGSELHHNVHRPRHIDTA